MNKYIMEQTQQKGWKILKVTGSTKYNYILIKDYYMIFVNYIKVPSKYNTNKLIQRKYKKEINLLRNTNIPYFILREFWAKPNRNKLVKIRIS